MKDLKDLNPATLQLLKKLVTAACKDTREGLGQTAGVFAIDETVVLRAEGTVKVDRSSTNAGNAQRARPWDLLVALQQTANERLAAAGLTGIDLAAVVEAAQNIDAKLSEKAQKEADTLMAAKRVADPKFKWGGVKPTGSVAVLATGDHRVTETTDAAADTDTDAEAANG